MSDVAGYPAANQAAQPYPAANQAAVMPLELTPAETEEVDRLYEKLKTEGVAAARAHVMCHTPPRYSAEMTARIDADFPPTPPV